MTKSAKLLLATLSIGVLLASPDQLTPEFQRKAPADFTLTDATGKALTLSRFKGKVVLLDFWATSCGGCKVEIPWYIEFQKAYGSHGLVVVGVSMDDEGMKAVKPFVAQNGINYPVVIGNDDIAAKYQLTAMPMTLLIDRQGRTALSHTGIIDKAAFEKALQTLLKRSN